MVWDTAQRSSNDPALRVTEMFAYVTDQQTLSQSLVSCLYRKDLGHYSCSSIGRKITQAFLDTLFWSESMAALHVTVNVVILKCIAISSLKPFIQDGE